MLLGRRISLGPVIPADFPSMFCWANDVDAARFDLAYRPVDFVQHTQWCESIGKDLSMVVFAIRKLNDPAIIGFVRLFNINSVHRSAEFGIRIGADAHRGQGYGKEATALALSFCWNHLNLNRVQLIAFAHNERALRCYAASGFAREGLLREAVFIQGEWVDLVVMAAFRAASEARERRPAAAEPVQLASAA
jgi:RimJ/RimL family protein N-acetyltransferase